MTVRFEVYYNEHDEKAAHWLRSLIAAGLIPPGIIDERSITEVQPDDLKEFTQCHFFAGIGEWSRALDLAKWPADVCVWTGSCPCQPFSAAGKQKGTGDERHLWPEFFRLIKQCRPDTVFGEQVEGAIKHGWLDDLSADLEGEGYTVGAAVLGAHSVNAPHIRQRLYWVADSGRERIQSIGEPGFDSGSSREMQRETQERERLWSELESSSITDRLVDSISTRPQRHARDEHGSDESGWIGEDSERSIAAASSASGMGDTKSNGWQQRRAQSNGRNITTTDSHWSDSESILCRDGKARPVKPGVRLLAHGVSGRVAQLRGLGNAIVPQVAAQFIAAFMETLQ